MATPGIATFATEAGLPGLLAGNFFVAVVAPAAADVGLAAFDGVGLTAAGAAFAIAVLATTVGAWGAVLVGVAAGVAGGLAVAAVFGDFTGTLGVGA